MTASRQQRTTVTRWERRIRVEMIRRQCVERKEGFELVARRPKKEIDRLGPAEEQLKCSSALELDSRLHILRWLHTNIDDLQPRHHPHRTSGHLPVWSYWDPSDLGEPEIVRLCRRSHQQWLGDDLIALDRGNTSTYVDKSVFEIEKSCQISRTHFSDLLRLNLLAKHGGLWLDATTLLTGQPDALVTNSDVFLFLRPNDPFVVSSWCIRSNPQNHLIQLWFNALHRFWRDHVNLFHYFQMHFLLESMILLDPMIRHQFMGIPACSALRPHSVQNHLRSCVGDHACPMPELLESSWIHKLTYKDLPPESPQLLTQFLP